MPLRTVLVIAGALAFPLAVQGQVSSIPSQSAWFEPERERHPTVSADVLRHPISFRSHRMLKRAIDRMRSGEHQKAIQQLEATLAKDPSSAPYVHSLLGYELMRTDQFAAAIRCFEQAVLLLPHDAVNHHNFAVSLLMAGNYERAEEEARRAHDLAPDNPTIQRLLDILVSNNSHRGTLDARRLPH